MTIDTIFAALHECDGFIGGFEGDDLQDGLPEILMAKIDAARAETRDIETRLASMTGALRDLAEYLKSGTVAGCPMAEGDMLDRVQESLGIAPLPAESTAAPTPTVEKPKCAHCGNDGTEGGLYVAADLRWQPEAGAWELQEREATEGRELDCTACDGRTPVNAAWLPLGLLIPRS